MPGKPRVKDLARQLGVSSATISRALNGSELVAEPMREKVLALAAELGYRPNTNARSLRTQQAKSVLLVVRDIANPFYLDVLKGVERTAWASGYSVLMGNTENDPERELEYFEMLGDGHADGMILMTGKLPSVSRRGSQLSTKPVVVALEMIDGANLPQVLIDNVAAAEAAVDHLLSLGHRRIAHISGPAEGMSTRRRSGYCAAMQNFGLPIPPGYIQPGDFSLRSGHDRCRDLLDLTEPPTAIFAANDEMAFGAMRAVHEAGLSVPNDVSIVGFDDLFLSEAFLPALTTVSQPKLEVGQAAMKVLLDLVSGKPADLTPVVLPTSLTVRESTAPPPNHSKL